MPAETKVKLFELTRMLPDLPVGSKQRKWIERLQAHPSLVPGETLYVPTAELEICKELMRASKVQRQSASRMDAQPRPVDSEGDSQQDER